MKSQRQYEKEIKKLKMNKMNWKVIAIGFIFGILLLFIFYSYYVFKYYDSQEELSNCESRQEISCSNENGVWCFTIRCYYENGMLFKDYHECWDTEKEKCDNSLNRVNNLNENCEVIN